MQRYGVIYADMWQDEDFKPLSNTAKLVYVYLLSSPHSNMSGYYKLPIAYASEDLGIDRIECECALDELSHSGFVYNDVRHEIVLIRTYLKHNKISNDKQAKGAWNQVDRLPLSPLTVEYAHLCLLYAPAIIRHFDGRTIRYLADNHITKDGIDLSGRLAVERNDYMLLLNTLKDTDTETGTEQ